jgi:hypothetical protein
LFDKKLSEAELSALLDALCERAVVGIERTKVRYDLPLEP